MYVTAIVPSAGLSRRFGMNKPFLMLLNKPLIAWTLLALNEVDEVTEIIPVLKKEDMDRGLELVERFSITKVKKIASGGAERQDSVLNGLRLISDNPHLVLIHDGVRPLTPKSLIQNTISELLSPAAKNYDGVITAIPLKDTIKETDENLFVRKTLRRETLCCVQTPQVFRYDTIISVYLKAVSEGFLGTDDSCLVEIYGGRVKVIMGSYRNIKITTPEDLIIAEVFLNIKGQPQLQTQ